MPSRSPRTPSYRLHKPTGLAVVTLDGRDTYLGRYNSIESRAEYDRLIGEWLMRGRSAAPKPGAGASVTVTELAVAFWKHAEQHYRTPAGEPSHELQNLRDAIRPVRKLYGSKPAAEFGPLALRAVRAKMVESGLARTTANARVNRIRRVFGWGASVEMIPASVVEALKTVEALQKGRSGARESPGIKSVPVGLVDPVLPFLPRPVAAMVRLQLLTGCRAGEVMVMRTCDIHPTDPNWEYRPGHHKSSWRGLDRAIPLGPKARTILAEFLRLDQPNAYLFTPARRGAVGDKRTRTRKGTQKYLPHYNRRSYRQAVVRACDRAFPSGEAEIMAEIGREGLTPGQRSELRRSLRTWRQEHRDELSGWRREHRWSPLQLRHTAGTLIRAKFDLETARTVLGHVSVATTEIYAERDAARAHAVASAIG